ncbi:glycosyltransferase [Faecalibacter macacae]|uniref:Glycosyltransferase n=1 Tax=Faecalibacter macacae TaxID=1859289 RepID=A0A3L9MCK3_9FLAO|nr:glycosyltransferase [Faecalibacter macacae]RLZ10551.1 glycosyltransferase [Faecalibacter macacae]
MKIIIVNPHMKIGGIATSLNNWSEYFKIKNIKVDYVIFRKEYDLKFQNFFETNQVIHPKGTNKLSKVNFNNRIKNIIYKILTLIGIINFLKVRLTKKHKLPNSYDIAISFSNDVPKFKNVLMSNDFVMNSINAKYKVAWIHNDIDKLGFTRSYALERYKNFDAIVNVSEACKQQFDKLVPEFIHKSFVVRNAINTEKLNELANSATQINFNQDIFNFVTVARIYNEQKRIDRILDIVDNLKKDNLSFHWYIIGDGPDLKNLTQLCKERKLEDKISFLGFKSNPYPYMKKASYVVLTSDYEAQGMVISEALSLGTPVISTNFDAAKEFIIDHQNGYLVKNNAQSFSELLNQLITKKITLNIQENKVYDSDGDFERLINFIEKQ